MAVISVEGSVGTADETEYGHSLGNSGMGISALSLEYTNVATVDIHKILPPTLTCLTSE